MNIIVCVKQVPVTNQVKMDNKNHTMQRENIDSRTNAFDLNAIEEALRIKEQMGGTVTVLCMGVLSVEKKLKELYALGVDEVILLSDRKFAGADSLATAYTLSKGIEKISDYDLILCGLQSTDGDTGQVGPSVAAKLDIPHITCVVNIETIENESILCKRLVEGGHEYVQIKLPGLITVTNEINEPRKPLIKDILKARSKSVKIWDCDAVNADSNACGLKGSPTRVTRTFKVGSTKEVKFIEGDKNKKAEALLRILSEVK